MEKEIQTIDEKKFFRLPLEKGTFCLLERTLDAHSTFRRPAYHFRIETSKLSFRNEILTLSVKLPDEPKKLVFLKVTEKELLVSCSFDTDYTFLSRYAYFALKNKMDYSEKACFANYYWPDFFDPTTGRSKYLKIINDRKGFDVFLKSTYPPFYKPGDTLLDLPTAHEIPKAELTRKIQLEDHPTTDKAIGFALADTNLSSIHSNHYPFLIPFHGVLTKDKEKIKSFSSVLVTDREINVLAPTQRQRELTKICFKMLQLAPVSNPSFQSKFIANEEEMERGKQLFRLWHQAYEGILSQRYVFFFRTLGLKNIKRKPTRSRMQPCEFKKERPQLLIKRMDKGEYYQIELGFRINGKMNTPHYPNLAFFIRPKAHWLRKYLLENFDDYLVTSFFAKTHYKLAVLKSHYNGDFEDFINQLAERYEVMDS